MLAVPLTYYYNNFMCIYQRNKKPAAKLKLHFYTLSAFVFMIYARYRKHKSESVKKVMYIHHM